MVFFEGGGGWTPLDKASQTNFSHSARKASKICLRGLLSWSGAAMASLGASGVADGTTAVGTKKNLVNFGSQTKKF